LANVGNWEAEGIGLNLETFSQCTGPSEFSALTAVIMLIVDSILYGSLFIYFDEIFPGKHGIGLHWTYIFDKNYWTSQKSDKVQLKEDQRGIELLRVEKHYFSGGKITRAVNGISTKFRENEISTLLGFNGSGKTTALKMLAAMHSPTEGEIIINGLDLSKNTAFVRKTLGYCPQYNILIEDLTVIEHLQLFTSLKGLHGENRDIEVELSIKKLKFEEHRNANVQHLSGGMKRKLSLGLALCGHPNVVILGNFEFTNLSSALTLVLIPNR
jgi:ATP-binding cassette subfamily A (ABC1) protein 3